MKTNSGKIITVSVIAATYVILTYVSMAFGLAYGGIQFRISEALTVLALFSPEAVWGLTLGCALGNIASPLGIVDVIFGTAATLFATLCIRFLASRFTNNYVKCIFCGIFSAFFNGIIISAEIVFFDTGVTATWALFGINALCIAVGELAVCLLLCYPIYRLIEKNNILNNFFVCKRS